MANKRNLKKQVRYICGDLAGECIMAREVFPSVNAEDANNIVIEIAGLQTSTINKMTFAFDKCVRDFENRQAYNKARSAYYSAAYKTLTEEFNASTKEIVKKMNSLLNKEIREANKSTATAE
ncbi:MAG: hypothetical protein K2L49_01095 [Muribaculaceae bacterium]|nr:hypothetical protein [Muribaculaceae bacterium]